MKSAFIFLLLLFNLITLSLHLTQHFTIYLVNYITYVLHYTVKNSDKLLANNFQAEDTNLHERPYLIDPRDMVRKKQTNKQTNKPHMFLIWSSALSLGTTNTVTVKKKIRWIRKIVTSSTFLLKELQTWNEKECESKNQWRWGSRLIYPRNFLIE